jgi:toxin HigB-1
MYPLRGYTSLVMITQVELSKDVQKELKKLPSHIVTKLQAWTDMVEKIGLEEARKIPGFHDEPLKGSRQGQRSIRLSRSYRAIYVIKKDSVEFVFVEEVHKHDY